MQTIFSLSALFGFAWATAFLSPARAAGPPDYWVMNYEEGLKMARETGKPALLDFSAEWCAPCRHMNENVYPQESVIEVLENFVPIYIDTDEHEDLSEQYEVVGLPTYVFLSPEGEEEDRLVGGFYEAENYIDYLNTFLESREKLKTLKRQLEENPESPEVWKQLGDVYNEKGDRKKTIEAYEKALFYGPKDEFGIADNLYFLKALPSTEEEMEQAGEKLAKFEEQFPDSELLPKVFLYRVYIAADLSQILEDPSMDGKALALIEEGLKRFPDSEYAEDLREIKPEIEARIEENGSDEN